MMTTQRLCPEVSQLAGDLYLEDDRWTMTPQAFERWEKWLSALPSDRRRSVAIDLGVLAARYVRREPKRSASVSAILYLFAVQLLGEKAKDIFAQQGAQPGQLFVERRARPVGPRKVDPMLLQRHLQRKIR